MKAGMLELETGTGFWGASENTIICGNGVKEDILEVKRSRKEKENR